MQPQSSGFFSLFFCFYLEVISLLQMIRHVTFTK